jgi:hypothetical protein
MTLTELQNEVYAITNRPDMATQTQSAVRNATLSIHQADYFYKDLFETGIDLEVEDFLQAFDYLNPMPRFRSIKYIRKSDASGTGDGKFLDIVVPELVTDAYKINRTDIAYLAGDIIQIKSSTPLRYILVGAYVNPDITVASFSSWVARDHPFAIVALAAARIFKQVGKDSEYAVWTGEARDELNKVRISNIVAKGE